MLKHTISPAECEAQWKDIKRLCSIKPLGRRDWRSDVGYGLMDIYLDAAGLPLDYCPDANLMHGMFLGMTDYWYLHSEANFHSVPVLIVHNEFDRVHLQKVLGPVKRVLVVAHPIHYIIAHYQSEQQPEPLGSVFFFPHSLGQPIPLVPIDYVLKKLNNLPQKYHPIDVCLHVADVDDALISKIHSFGLGVVSCGHRHDPLFLHRLYWLCRRRKYSINSNASTQLWLSALVGCEIVLWKDIPTVFMIPANDSWDFFLPIRENYWPLLDALYQDSIDQVIVKKLILESTGINYYKSPNELTKIFLRAHELYSKWRKVNGRLIFPPKYWSLIEPLYRYYNMYRSALTNRLSGNRGKWSIVESNPSLLLMKYSRAEALEN